MLRKIKILFYSIIVITVIAVLAEALHSYDNNSLPDSPTIIAVSPKLRTKTTTLDKDWNKNTKAEIFTKLTEFAQAQDISLAKVRLNSFNNQKSKVVYSFNKPANEFSLFRAARIKKLTRKELNLEDLFGVYYTDARGDSLTKLLVKFKALQVNVQTSDTSLSLKTLLLLLLGNLSQSLLVVSVSVIGVLFIIMLLEKIYRFKPYAVMKISGLSTRQIIGRDLKEQTRPLGITLSLIIAGTAIWGVREFTPAGWGLFARSAILIILLVYATFLFLDVFSYVVLALMDPYQAIKGAENSRPFLITGYILKVLLLILVVINAISLRVNMQTYARDTAIIKKWNNEKSGYLLGLNWNIDDRRIDESVARQAHRLVVHARDVVISQNSENFHPARRDTDPESGNVIIANDNFVKESVLRSEQDELDPDKVTMFVPRDRLDQVRQARKQFMKLFKFQRTLPNYYGKARKPRIQAVAVASNQRIFNYAIGEAISSSLSIDPIVIVINDKIFADDFYLASISQGLIRFPHLKQLKNLVRRFGLTSYNTGFTSQQALLEDYNVKAGWEFLMLTITTILSLLQLVFIILFVSSTFLQSQRRKLALYQVFGKSNVRLVAGFLLANLGLDLLITVLILVKLDYLQLMPLALAYLLLETIVILLTYQRTQRNLLITLNHGN